MQASSINLVCLLAFLLCQSSPSNAYCKWWNSASHVKCDELEDIVHLPQPDHVISLKLEIRDDHLPENIFNRLTALKSLDLSNGRLKNIRRAKINKIKTLRHLNLAHNHFKDFHYDDFSEFTPLRTLNLSHNRFESIPEALLNLQDLRVLDLSGNELMCNCETLKIRDVLLSNKNQFTDSSRCYGPTFIKDKLLTEPDTGEMCGEEEVRLDYRRQKRSGEKDSDDLKEPIQDNDDVAPPDPPVPEHGPWRKYPAENETWPTYEPPEKGEMPLVEKSVQ